MHKSVFISHSSKDGEVANNLCNCLEKVGVGCWIAPRDIKGGEDYGAAIIDGIRSCSIFLLLWTEHSNSSTAVTKETERAFNYGKTTVPLRVREATPSKSLEFYLSNAQWVDATRRPIDELADYLAGLVHAEESRNAESVSVAEPVLKKLRGFRKRTVAGFVAGLLAVAIGAVYLTSVGNRNQKLLPPLQTLDPGYDKNVEASKRAHDLAVEAGKATMKPIGTEKPAPTGKSGASETMLPLGMIVSEVSIPLTAEYNVVDWRVLDGTGVKWAGEIKANHSGYVRTGTIDGKGYGNIAVMATGARGFFNEVSLSYKLMPNSHNSNSEIESLIQKQLNEGSKVKLIRGTCDWEGASTNSAVYEVTVPGKKPVVVFYQFEAGGSAGLTGYDLVVSQGKKYPCDKAASW